MVLHRLSSCSFRFAIAALVVGQDRRFFRATKIDMVDAGVTSPLLRSASARKAPQEKMLFFFKRGEKKTPREGGYRVEQQSVNTGRAERGRLSDQVDRIEIRNGQGLPKLKFRAITNSKKKV